MADLNHDSSKQEGDNFASAGFPADASFQAEFPNGISPQLSRLFQKMVAHQQEYGFHVQPLVGQFLKLQAFGLTEGEYGILKNVTETLCVLKYDTTGFFDNFIQLKTVSLPSIVTGLLNTSLKHANVVSIFDTLGFFRAVLDICADPDKKLFLERINEKVEIRDLRSQQAKESESRRINPPSEDILFSSGVEVVANEMISQILDEISLSDVVFEVVPFDGDEDIVDSTPSKQRALSKPSEKETCTREEIREIILGLPNLHNQWIEFIDRAVHHNNALELPVLPIYSLLVKLGSNAPSPNLAEIIEDCLTLYEREKWDVTGLLNALTKSRQESFDQFFVSSFRNLLVTIQGDAQKAGIFLPGKVSPGTCEPRDIEWCFSIPEEISAIYGKGTVDYHRLIETKMLFTQIEQGVKFLVTEDRSLFSHRGRIKSQPNDIEFELRRALLTHREGVILVEVLGKALARGGGVVEASRFPGGQGFSFLVQQVEHGTFSLQPFITLRNSLDRNEINGHREVKQALRTVLVHSLLSIMVRSSDEETRNLASFLVSRETSSDDSPFVGARNRRARQEDEERLSYAQEANRQTLSVYQRAFDIHHGAFTSLTFECRRTPDGEFPLLARFANEVGMRGREDGAEPILFIDAKHADRFPGRGFLIRHLDPAKIFIADKEKPEDPFHLYKAAWTDFANGTTLGSVIDDLRDTQFVFMRGVIAITGPNVPRYFIKDRNNVLTHYSLVVFNDHFENKGCTVAYLVPTDVINRRLEGTTIRYDDFRGYGHAATDATKARWRFEDLVEDTIKRGANVINLGWGSNFGGTLSNAFPPQSAPYHNWESELGKRSSARDAYGHTHKSYSEIDLSVFREAHVKVYLAANAYFDLFSLFNISLEIYHKGETSGEIIQVGDIDEFSLAGIENEQLEPEAGSGLNPNAIRMLREAYRWHDVEKPPVLAPVNVFDMWGVVKDPLFLLDTSTMTLRLSNGFVYQFPKNEYALGPSEIGVWETALSQIIGPEKFHLGLRFLDRELIPLEYLKRQYENSFKRSTE